MANEDIGKMGAGSSQAGKPTNIPGVSFQEQEPTPQYREVSLAENRRSLAQAAAGMNKIGEALGGAAQMVLDAYKERQKVSRATAVSNAYVSSDLEFQNEMKAYLRENPDPDAIPKDVEKLYDKAVDDAAQGLPDDRETQAQFRLHTNNRKVSVLDRAFAESNSRWLSKQRGDLATQIEVLKELGSKADTTDEFIQHGNEMDEIVNSKTGNILPENEAMQLKIEIKKDYDARRQKYVVADVERQISIDPLSAYLQLASGHGYQEIKDPLVREHLTQKAEQTLRVRQTQELHDAEALKQKLHDEDAIGLFHLLRTGALTPQELEKRTGIPEKEKVWWYDKIEERSRMSINIKTNFKTYAEIYDNIQTGAKSKKEIIDDIGRASKTDLSENDAVGLLGHLYGSQKNEDTPWLQRSHEYLKTQIFSSMVPELVKPEEYELYIRASNDLDKAIAEARHKKTPLTGEAIFNKAREIAQGYRLTETQKQNLAKQRRKGVIKPLTPQDKNQMDRDAGL